MKRRVQNAVTLILADVGVAFLALLAAPRMESMAEEFAAAVLLAAVLLILWTAACDPMQIFLRASEQDREEKRLREALNRAQLAQQRASRYWELYIEEKMRVYALTARVKNDLKEIDELKSMLAKPYSGPGAEAAPEGDGPNG